MSHLTNLCQQYEPGVHVFDRNEAPSYHAVHETRDLPSESQSDSHITRRGYAVGFGQWFYFNDAAPAATFARVVRAAYEVTGVGMFAAAHLIRWCSIHHGDERVLLVSLTEDDPAVQRNNPEKQLELMKRFVQGAKERPWQSRWSPPTGFMTEYNEGRPRTTTRSSLPL